MTKLPLEEQETVLSMAGDERETWHVFSNDTIMQKKLEAAGAVLVRKSKKGLGKFYTLRTDQVMLRKKRTLSEERRAQLSERMQDVRKAQ